MIPDTCSYAPRKLGASNRAVPPAVKPIKTPERKLRDLVAVAASDASELQATWEKRIDSKPGVQDELLYSELRYAQGRADALQEALDLLFGGQA